MSRQVVEGDVLSILKQFSERAYEVDLVVDGGVCVSNIPSTILEVCGDTVKVLREGAVPITQLTSFL